MAKKPDGKPARVERVTFTKPAAERIGRVVRQVEAGNRDQGPLTFGPRVGSGGGTSVRMAYYTATVAWNRITFTAATSHTNTMKIQFAFPTAQTAATALAVNHFVSLDVQSTNVTAATRAITVMKEAGMWRLIAAEC